LIEQCKVKFSADYQDCELNSTNILGLHSIYYLAIHSAASQCNTDETLSFFCNATLLLCNGNSSTVELTEACEEVRDNKCASEWRTVENICKRSVPDCMSHTEDGNLAFSKAPKQSCPTGFDHFCGSICLPVCNEYFLATEETPIYYFRYVAVTMAILGLIIGIITIIVCYYKSHKL